MTSLTLSRPRQPRVLAEMFARQPQLANFGIATFLLGLATLTLQLVDPRTLDSVSVWVKPTKFFFSVSIFALTATWFIGYVAPERRQGRAISYVVWTTILAGGFELAYIVVQATRGQESHFNTSTPATAIMYGLMGLGAVLLVSTCLALAWAIRRSPAPGLRPDFRFAVIAGLILTFLLGGGFGAFMSQTSGHSVGAEGGHFPLFGWNRSGGDLRIAHFMGMHFEQTLPFLAALVAPLPETRRWLIILGGMLTGAALTIAVFLQALAGLPFPG